MFFECHRHNLPKWWAAIVFAAPVTTPYFIIKSRKGKGFIWVLFIFFACVALVLAGEIFLYSRTKEQYKYEHLPPVTRQLIRYSEILKQTTHKLDTELVELELQSKVQSKVNKIEQTIVFIDELRKSMHDNREAIKQIVSFGEAHENFFLTQDLKWVYEIQKFYNNRIVTQHFESLEKYLDNFETLLRFCCENFDSINERKNLVVLKNYDEYYMRYRRAVDSHNRLNVKRIEFQNTYISRHPEIREYLPAKRQTEAFRLWE